MGDQDSAWKDWAYERQFHKFVRSIESEKGEFWGLSLTKRAVAKKLGAEA